MKDKLIVPESSRGLRIDKFLSDNLDSISRTKTHDLIKNGSVLVDGKFKKPSYLLKGAEIILIEREEEKNLDLKPFEFNVPIIYEDEDILIVDKPAELVVHPLHKDYDKTLVNALLYMKKELSTINVLRRGIVHRLDKATSGVMVLAKNNYTHLNLINQFKERKVNKEYWAFCWGRLKTDRMVIDLPLKRDERDRLKMKVSFCKAKTAYTEVLVKERFNETTLLIIKPLTGRMHQIRVHLRFAGYPIIGDKKYGRKDGYDNLFLHAHKLGFFHPRRGDFLEFESPIPERFKKLIEVYKGNSK